jgi:acetoin utilization protein AcuB
MLAHGTSAASRMGMHIDLHTSESIVTAHTTMRDVMTPLPRTINSTATVEEARLLMHDLHCHHLPVVEGGNLVGVVSDRDLLAVETLGGDSLRFERVSNAMTRRVYTARVDASLRDVARVMAAEHYGSTIVMADDAIAGIFTATDALRHLVAALR